MQPITVKGFPIGINNIEPDYAMPEGSARDIINADIYNDGKLRRRRGSVMSFGGLDIHSLWSDPRNPDPQIAFYVAGTSLFSLQYISGSLVSSTVATGLQRGAEVSYFELAGDIFWSNGFVNGRIRNGTLNVPWGVETPAKNPVLTAGVTGSLPAGHYQVVLTFRNSLGEESGATLAQGIDVLANGSITLTNMPQPASFDVIQTCIYCTPQNGDVMYKVAVVASSTTTFTITNASIGTTMLKTQFLSPMPAGVSICHLNGSIYVAQGNFIYYSEPFRYGLCNLRENFYQFPGEVDIVLGVPDEAGMRPQEGIFVCADKTYFILRAGTKEAENKIIFPFGGVRGTGTYLRNNTDVAWFSPRGQVTGSIGGHAKLLNDANYTPGKMTHGTSIVREYQGLKQIINTVEQTAISPLQYTGD